MEYEASGILLVEDEEAHAELTKRAIRKAGNANQIDWVSNGEEAMDFLRDCSNLPGLILLDIKLPGMDGIEVLKQIKNDPGLKRIPVIMLTTSEREEDIARSYNNYANSYLTKPVGFKEFEEKVMQIDFYWLLVNMPPSS